MTNFTVNLFASRCVRSFMQLEGRYTKYLVRINSYGLVGSSLHCDWTVAGVAGNNELASGDVKHVLEPSLFGGWSVCGLSWIQEGNGARARSASYDGRTAVKKHYFFFARMASY